MKIFCVKSSLQQRSFTWKILLEALSSLLSSSQTSKAVDFSKAIKYSMQMLYLISQILDKDKTKKITKGNAQFCL